MSCPAERDRNACREGSFTPLARVNMADDTRQILYDSLKAVLTFQTLMLATLGKWATTQLRWKLQNTFCFFKTCWRLMGLSRLYDASQPPGWLQGT